MGDKITERADGVELDEYGINKALAPYERQHYIFSAIGAMKLAKDRGDVEVVRICLTDKIVLLAASMHPNFAYDLKVCTEWVERGEEYERVNGPGSMTNWDHPFTHVVAKILDEREKQRLTRNVPNTY